MKESCPVVSYYTTMFLYRLSKTTKEGVSIKVLRLRAEKTATQCQIIATKSWLVFALLRVLCDSCILLISFPFATISHFRLLQLLANTQFILIGVMPAVGFVPVARCGTLVHWALAALLLSAQHHQRLMGRGYQWTVLVSRYCIINTVIVPIDNHPEVYFYRKLLTTRYGPFTRRFVFQAPPPSSAFTSGNKLKVSVAVFANYTRNLMIRCCSVC
jgi:hypothetical protein